jgi:hypothetical protein
MLALAALRAKIGGSCAGCSQYVFRVLGSNQSELYKFLAFAPRLFDGTRSNAPGSVLCGLGAGISGLSKWVFCNPPDKTVSQYMASRPLDAAETQTPSDSGGGLMTFFVPPSICNSSGTTPAGVLNQAVLFHESLHGFTAGLTSTY